MYLCAKLVGIATAILSAGTVSPLVILYLKNTNSWLFKKDSSKHGYDFQELDNTAEKRLEKLTHWLSKFSSAKTASEGLKQLELEKMQPLFEKIFKTEEEIEKLFKNISETLTNLVKKHAELFTNSVKRLNTDKRKKLQETLQKKYSELKATLKTWETSLNQISCAIEKQDKKCERAETAGEISLLFSSVDSLFSYLLSAGGDGQDTQQQNGDNTQDSQAGAEKAKKELEEVKKVLLESVKDFQQQSVRYGTRLAFSLSNQKIATMLLIVFDAIINSLKEQIETLTSSIDENRKSSETKTQQINELQNQLKTSYAEYSSLQQLESLFQWWGKTFEEKVTQNQDDKARETVVSRRKK